MTLRMNRWKAAWVALTLLWLAFLVSIGRPMFPTKALQEERARGSVRAGWSDSHVDCFFAQAWRLSALHPRSSPKQRGTKLEGAACCRGSSERYGGGPSLLLRRRNCVVAHPCRSHVLDRAQLCLGEEKDANDMNLLALRPLVG